MVEIIILYFQITMLLCIGYINTTTLVMFCFLYCSKRRRAPPQPVSGSSLDITSVTSTKV